jgi:hypothetical protein
VSQVTLAERAAHKAKFDLAFFDAFTGAIPQNRLPANKALWPAPKYVNGLNLFLDGKAA